MQTLAVTPEPVEIAPETFLIPNLYPSGPDSFLPVNSLLIRGEEPVIVDTSAPIYRERWLEMVFGLVDPEDVRWIFLSHDDGDHTGGLYEALDACPRATLVTNFFSTERLALERGLPVERSIWREPGDTFDVGDRRLRLFKPPIFDGPTTRGLLDESTGAMWAVDSFAAAGPAGAQYAQDIPADVYNEVFPAFNSLVSPWHTWLDPVRYHAHVDSVEAMKPSVVASAHGPVLVGDAIHDAFDRVRDLAGQPIIPAPGEEVLHEMLAAMLTPA